MADRVLKTANYIQQRLARASAGFRYLPRAFALVWGVSPRLTGSWLTILIFQGLLPTITVFLTRALVNTGAAAIRSGGSWPLVKAAIWLGAAMGATYLAQQLLGEMAGLLRTAQSLRLRDHIATMIQRKSVEVDLAFYDSSDFYDRMHRARIDSNFRPVQLVEDAGILLQNGITVIAMIVIVARYSVWLPFAILLSSLPAIVVVVRAGMRSHEWARRATAAERQAWYYDALLTERQSAMEVRLFASGEFFQQAFSSVRRKLRAEQMRLARQDGLAEAGASLFSILCFAAALGGMTYRAVHGKISIGDLALFFQAFNQSLSLAGTALARVGQIYQNALFLGNVFEFLDLQPLVRPSNLARRAPEKLRTGIVFHDVHFRYPGSDRAALDGLNLTIEPGKVIALVGPNGTGKSTVAKLLCRFYDPEHGSIRLDGTNLHEFSIDELRRCISAFFQDPVRYNDTAAANILLGDLAIPGDEKESAIHSSARFSGFDEVIARLPHGPETRLGGRFLDGTELSGGEWQRAGLARAIARQSQILILDEPTSSMDPWAELEWAKQIHYAAAGRATLLITHRFTTAMFADEIFVLADGKIVESGNHRALLTANGMYARGWASQAPTKS